MRTSDFARFAGLCALGAGATGLLYSVAFIVIARVAPVLGQRLSTPEQASLTRLIR